MLRDFVSQNTFLKKNLLLDQTIVPGNSTFTYNISDFAFVKSEEHINLYQAYISNCNSQHLNLESLSTMLGEPVEGDGGVCWKASQYYKALERAGDIYDSFSYIRVDLHDLHYLTSEENLKLFQDFGAIMEISRNPNLLHDKISNEFCQAMSHTNINLFNELINIAQVNEMFAFVSISHHMVLILGFKACVAMYLQSPRKGFFLDALKKGCYTIKLKIPTYVAVRVTIKTMLVATPATAFYWIYNKNFITFLEQKSQLEIIQVPQIDLPIQPVDIPKTDLSSYTKIVVDSLTIISVNIAYHSTTLVRGVVKGFRLGAIGSGVIGLFKNLFK